MIRRLTMLLAPESATPPAAAPSTGTPQTPPAAPPAAPAATPAAQPAATAPAATPAATPAAQPAATPAPGTVLTDPPAAPPADGEIKLTFPKDFTPDKKLIDAFLPLAKDLGLKSEGAQKLMDLYVGAQNAQAQQHMETTTKWAEEARADPEIGGANFDANLAVAQRALGRLGTPGLKDLLAKSGLGNHKDVIRLFANIGKLISEDRLPGAKPPESGGDLDRQAQLKAAFPNSPELWG